MSLYSDLGPAIVATFVTDPYFSVFSTTPHLWRGTAATPAADGTAKTDRGAVAATVIRNTGSKTQQDAAGSGVWAADWLVMAASATDVRAGDTLSDGTRAYVVTATPETDAGFLLAPAEPIGVPA